MLIVLGGIVAIGSGIFLANRLINPIISLTESATQIAAGDLETEVPTVDRDDEVGLLARAFGQMTDNLQNSIRTLRQRGEELESRDQELRARTEQLEANQRAVRVVFAASEQSDPGELLRLTVNLIRDRFNMYHVQVYIVEEEENAAVLRESTGYAGLQLLQKEHLIPLDQSSLVTQAIHGGEPVVVNDVNQNPDFLANPLLPDTQSEMVVPLKVEERVIGAVDIQSRDTHTFTSDVVGLFETMTNQIALLFQNSELYLRTIEQTEELTHFTTQLRTAATVSERLSTILNPEELLNEVVELLQSRFGFYHAHIYMLDEKNEQLVVRAGSGEVGEVLRQREHSIPTNSAQSLVARAARERQVIMVNDTAVESGFLPNPLLPQTRAEAAVPLITGGNLLGVLDVQDDQPERFAESDLATFNTLAGQIATALDNARLFEEQRRLTAILRNSRDLVALTNLQGEITYMNEAGAKLAGYDSPEETLGRVISDFHMPEDFALVNDKAIPQVFKTGVWQGENRIRRPDGTLIPISQTIFVIQDDQGQPQSLATIITDITERKRAETALLDSQARLSEALDIAQLVSWEFDVERGVFIFNDSFYASLGTTAEQVGGYEMTAEEYAREFVPPKDAADVAENVQAAIMTDDPDYATEIESRVIRADGEIRHIIVRFRIEKDADGNTIKIIGANQDITERKQAEEAFIRLSRRNELILNSTAEGIFGVDQEGHTVFVNPAAVEMLGYSADELIGEKHHDLIHHHHADGSEYPAEECKVNAAYRDGTTHTGEDEIYWHKDGHNFPVAYTSTPITDDEGNILGAVVTFRDITEELEAREATEKRARELQTVAEVGTAAATELDPEELLQDVVNLTKENFSLYHAHIYLIDDAGETLKLAAGAGEAGQQMVAQGWSIAADSETSLVARAYHNREGVIANNVQAAPDFLPNPLLPDTASELAVPLIAGDQVLGVLDVQSDEVEHFTPQDVNIQTTLAGQIATALDNARLFEEQRRLTALLNNSEDYIAMANPQGEIIYVNPGGAKMIGYDDPNKIIGMRIADSHTPEDANHVLEEGIPVAMETGLWRGENRLKHRDGHLIPVDQTIFIIRDDEGEVESLATIMIDITDRLEAEQRIREINERFTLAKESIELGVWDWDVQNDELIWDDTMYKLYGIEKEEFIGAYEAWTSGLHPDDAEASAAALQAALEGKGEFDVEFRVVHPDGEIRYLKGDAVIIRDDDGAPLRAVGINYDITEQKKAEQELIQRAAELQTVAEVSTAAATELDPEELLQDVVNLTKENFSLYHAHIYLIDDAGETLKLAAGAGEAGQQMVAQGWSIPADSETSLVARAYRNREGVIANDVQAAPDFLPNPLLPDTASELAVPLIAGDDVLGVLDVQSDEVEHFTPQDVNIQTTLAGQVATALENARLFEEQQRLTAILNNSDDYIALTNLQGELIYVNPGGAKMIGYDDPSEVIEKLSIADSHTPEDANHVLEEGIPVAMKTGLWRGENRLKHRDGHLIPVDQTIFVIRDDEGEVQTLATIMIDITEQKKAEQELIQRAAELQTVAEVGTAAAASLDPQELLLQVSELTRERFGLYHAHIYLIDDAGETLKLAAGAGEAGQQMVAQGWSIPADSETSLVARAYRNREGVIANDVQAAPDFLPNPLLPDTASELAVPLIAGDDVLGVMDVQSARVGRFTDADVSIQTTLAGQIATALENARLFEEQRRLTAILNNSNDFIALTNLQGEITYINPGGMELLGYDDLADVISKAIPDFHTPEDTARVLKEGVPVAMEEGAWRGENRLKHRDGRLIPVDQTIFIIRDDEGAPQNLATIMIDITDRKRTMEEINKLALVAQETDNAIIITNAEKQIEWVNDGFTRLTEYTMEEVLGKKPGDFLQGEETNQETVQRIREAIERRESITAELINYSKSGRTYWLEINVQPIFGESGEVEKFIAIESDVTDRRNTQEEIRKRAAELQTVAEVSTSASSTLDTEKLLQEVVDLTKERFNLYHAHIYLIDDTDDTLKLAAGAGEAGQRMLEQGWSINAHSETSLVARAFRTREGVIENDVQAAPDFLPNPLLPDTASELAVPLIVSDRVLGVLDVQSDIVDRFTEQDVAIKTTLARQVATALDNARLFQEAQQVADRLREVDRMKSEFLANMSHELRTPLNSILGYTQLLLLDLEDTLPQENLEDMQSIHLNGQHLLSMINDILDLAKIEAGRLNLNFEELEIGALLESVQASNSGLFLDKSIKMVIDMEEDVPAIWADSVRMTQVLNNLVANAVKFTDEGEITIRAYQVDDGVNVEVKDEGIGIDEEDMDKLFERFRQIDGSYTRRAEGTGLGLPITRHLVEMHGGNINVESEVGKGSTFTIHLPTIEAAKIYIEENVQQYVEG
ncbi:MAG: PAS domain S-box protein [Anaerolineales bacterium]